MIANIEKVISDQFPFISIKLCTLNNSSTVKIQLSKNRQFIQITLILTAFNRETWELVNFLENQTNMASKNAVKPCPKITIKTKHLWDNFIDVIMTEIEDDKNWKNTLASKFECEEKEIANKSINEMRNIMDSWIEKKDIITEENKGKISFETRTLANQFLSELTSLVLCNLTINQLEIHSKDYFPKKCTVELSCNSIKNTIENEPPPKTKTKEKEEIVIGSAIVKEELSCNDIDFYLDGILDVCEETRLNLEKEKTQKRRRRNCEKEKERKKSSVKTYKNLHSERTLTRIS